MTGASMGKAVWHVTMSLDGFIAGPNDAMDWVFGYVPLDSAETRAMLEEAIRTTGSLLSGRRSYNVGRKPGQRPEARKVLGGAWSGPGFVLTHKAPEERRGSVDRVRVGQHPGRDRAGARGRRWEERDGDWGRRGAAVRRGGLMDEICIFLAPVLLGHGVRFFNWPGAPRAVRLETLELTRAGQMTNLRSRVVK
jgi:dihydrofolate reductase